ncbi:hypothetical protein Raf01_71160 [Rugosimonospora africana]|uniref:Uncharacterized protein n=1 Tax=Rugosimonospora africana TaxID=556532 RepID=A0A8J3QZ82_9ACTN|nr:hypothetical protein Raf01_71160 [Rugosimonospora africana]
MAGIQVPPLVIAGSDTFPRLMTAAEQVVRAVPSARYLSLGLVRAVPVIGARSVAPGYPP